MNCCDGQMSWWAYLGAIFILGALVTIIRLSRTFLVRSWREETTDIHPPRVDPR